MRLLHTSDWHLGHKFMHQSRDIEHTLALDWLIDTIEKEAIDVLLVAGDVFDVNNPPVSAEEIYYNFLKKMIPTRCRHIVIIGGNHDLPSRLNAPSGILKALDVHVVGCATDDIEDEIIELKEKDGTISAVVAAVPFLRDRDFKISISGERSEERIQRIKDGIYGHYQAIEQCLTDKKGRWHSKITAKNRPPLIVTGHLYAKGASAAAEQNNIYIGNLENIAAEQFPAIFDYVALGHIHRPQKVGKKDHIRYCGSLIPLNFSEIKDEKLVLVCDFSAGKGLEKITEIKVPLFRKLISIKGNLEELEVKLKKANDPNASLPAWVEVVFNAENPVSNIDLKLREITQNLNLEILKIRNERQYQSLDQLAPAEALDNLTPEEVFLKKCSGRTDAEIAELTDAFRELKESL